MATAQPQYEFDESQNKLIDGLGYKMQGVGFFNVFVGILYLLIGALSLIKEVRQPADYLVSATLFLTSLVMLCLGVWTRTAGTSFRQIVATKGNDISHLMSALGKLRNVYSLLYFIIVVYLILIIVVAIAAGIIAFMITRGAS
jgi:hypothetical protein